MSRCRFFRTRARPIIAGSGGCPTISPGNALSTTTSIATPSLATSRTPSRSGFANWRLCRSDWIDPDRAYDRRCGRRCVVVRAWALYRTARYTLHSRYTRTPASTGTAGRRFPARQCHSGAKRLSSRMDDRRPGRYHSQHALARCARSATRGRSRACQRLCPGPAWQRSPDRDRRPFRRAQLVERGARQSGTGGVARLSPRGGRRVARCRLCCGADARCTGRSASAIPATIVEYPDHPQRH